MQVTFDSKTGKPKTKLKQVELRHMKNTQQLANQLAKVLDGEAGRAADDARMSLESLLTALA